jgi:hypothetical protein
MTYTCDICMTPSDPTPVGKRPSGWITGSDVTMSVITSRGHSRPIGEICSTCARMSLTQLLDKYQQGEDDREVPVIVAPAPLNAGQFVGGSGGGGGGSGVGVHNSGMVENDPFIP